MGEQVIAFNKKLEAKVRKAFEEEATPEFLNILRAAKAAYEHGFHEFITQEKFLEFMKRCYEGGKNQKDIRQGRGKGDEKILINGSDVMNMAAYLSMYGKKEGYLSR